MKKISFDFDGVLEFQSVQDYAKKLMEKGIEVHIVTSRYKDPNTYPFRCDHNDLFEVVDKLGIEKENIHFTEMQDKYTFFNNNLGFIWHLDDDHLEVTLINYNSKVKGIWSLSGNFEHECNELLNTSNE